MPDAHDEFRDGGETIRWEITVGEVDWVEPSDRVHRAVNVGKEVFIDQGVPRTPFKSTRIYHGDASIPLLRIPSVA